MSIKGSMSFACLKSCLNHAMLNYKKNNSNELKTSNQISIKKKKETEKAIQW